MRETGECSVLAFEKDAREDKNIGKEPRLPLVKPEPHERADARRTDTVTETD